MGVVQTELCKKSSNFVRKPTCGLIGADLKKHLYMQVFNGGMKQS